MKLRDLLYKIEGELDGTISTSAVDVLIVTDAGARLEPIAAAFDGELLIINARADNDCEGCKHCQFPGIRWPSSPDSNTDQSFLEKCDYCERYESDADAAIALVEALGGNIRIGCAMRANYTGLPWNDAVRWFPEGGSAKEINESDLWPCSGYSLCVDRPERDGEESP